MTLGGASLISFSRPPDRPAHIDQNRDVMIKSLTIIFLLQFCGEALARALKLPVPGSVIGMIFLAALLGAGRVRPDQVRPGASVLLENLSFLFVPPGVGLMLYFDLIGDQALAITLSLVLSTAAVMTVVGLIVQVWEKP